MQDSVEVIKMLVDSLVEASVANFKAWLDSSNNQVVELEKKLAQVERVRLAQDKQFEQLYKRVKAYEVSDPAMTKLYEAVDVLLKARTPADREKARLAVALAMGVAKKHVDDIPF